MQVFILKLFLILSFLSYFPLFPLTRSSFLSYPLLPSPSLPPLSLYYFLSSVLSCSLPSFSPLSSPYLPPSLSPLLPFSLPLPFSLLFSPVLFFPPLSLCLLSSPLSSMFLDYALRHPSQLLKSSYFFFFQLSRFPELMLSINDFKVKHVACI